MQHLTAAPIWVWPLFFILLAVGLRGLWPREVPVAAAFALPLMGLIGINSIASLSPNAAVWLLYGAAFLGSAVQAAHAAPKLIEWHRGSRVRLRGEAMTLVCVMVLFWANYAVGLTQAIRPDLLMIPGVTAGFAVLVGAASGQFMGRAFGIVRHTRRQD
ncbi:MAG: hypothetical protein AB8B71_03290 [Paracoccaceae bacterium]